MQQSDVEPPPNVLPLEVDQEDSLPAGKTIGPYIIEAAIGEGGMGAVYKATHAQLRKSVALKVIRTRAGMRRDLVERFLREGRNACNIRHPHVVDVTDIGSDGGVAYLVMEYLEGVNLQTFLSNHSKGLGVEECLTIFLPVVSGVAAAHDRGVVHRDLKPPNIFLTRDPRTNDLHPKVLDFGIAKGLDNDDETLTHTSALLGTPNYLSPEQAKNSKAVDRRSDQYSLVVILYEMLTGVQPFRGHESLLATLSAVATGSFRRPCQVRPELDPELEAIILRGMSLDREARFADVCELGRALLPFAAASTRALFEREFSVDRVRAEPIRAKQEAPSDSFGDAPTAAEGVPTAATRVDVTPKGPPAIAEIGFSVAHPSRARKWVFAASAALSLALVVYGVVSTQDKPESPAASPPSAPAFRGSELEATQPTRVPDAIEIYVTAEPSQATIELDGNLIGIGSAHAESPADGRFHRLVVSAAGFTTQVHSFRNDPPPTAIALAPIDTEVRNTPSPSVARDEGARTPSQRVRTPAASSPPPEPAVDRGANGAPRFD